MKRLEFIDQHELLYSNLNKLKTTIGVTVEDIENGEIEGVWYDCDYIKIDGEKGRGDFPFFIIEFKTVVYFISMSEWNEETIELATWFWNGAVDEADIDNNWKTWDKVKTGVAYRGGSGYYYALYAKEMTN